MHSILFLGYSNFLKTRILPIISSVDIQSVSIAKFRGQSWDEDVRRYSAPIRLYDNYEEALERFQGDMVYVSTVNSAHYKYALLSLEKGFHVIIDKPATILQEEAARLVEVAAQKRLLLSEATVYLMHPQFSLLDELFIKNEDTPKLITAYLSMPPFKDDNFRYRKELGGGAILDTAPYVVSTGRHFFKTLPHHVQCFVNERNEDGLEIAYSVMMKYENGRCLVGHFGFNTEYINQILIMGDRTNVSFNRVFTIPDNLENVLHITSRNVASEARSKVGNNYQLYLEHVLKKMDEGDYDGFYSDLLLDAQAKEMIFNNII